MSQKISHNKIKNSGILFELLSRQITADILNDAKSSKTVNLLKRYFNENTELGKELQLYQVLLKENYSSESKSNHLIDAVIKSRQKLKNSVLRREKYNLIKEIKKQFNVDDFFRARIPNYKVLASIYKLFISESSVGEFDPTATVNSRYTILEHITRNHVEKTTKLNTTTENYQKQGKDLRLLAYKLIVDKFNKKYSSILNESQKKLLKEYIYNISNTNKLREYVDSEVMRIEVGLKDLLPKVDDKITKIKLSESISQLPLLSKGKIVRDKQVVTLMRYYQLLEEVSRVISNKPTEKLNG